MSRFAILLCTHDGEAHLEQQLESLLAQTYPPVALFAHDWRSSDTTRAILTAFARRARARFPVKLTFHDEAPGARDSFFAGIRSSLQATVAFDYLALCDQDDVWRADKLEHYAAAIAAEVGPHPVMLCSDVRLIDHDGREISTSFYGRGSVFRPPVQTCDPGLLLANPLIGMTMAIPRAVLLVCEPRLGGPWLMHDWALILLGSSQGCRVRYISAPLVYYRQHSGNLLGASQGFRIKTRLQRARAHFVKLRAQCALLDDCSVQALGPHARPLVGTRRSNRLAAARVALASRLFQPRARVLLAAAILLFW